MRTRQSESIWGPAISYAVVPISGRFLPNWWNWIAQRSWFGRLVYRAFVFCVGRFFGWTTDPLYELEVRADYAAYGREQGEPNPYAEVSCVTNYHTGESLPFDLPEEAELILEKRCLTDAIASHLIT